jgi:hypothetical protein
LSRDYFDFDKQCNKSRSGQTNGDIVTQEIEPLSAAAVIKSVDRPYLPSSAVIIKQQGQQPLLHGRARVRETASSFTLCSSSSQEKLLVFFFFFFFQSTGSATGPENV